VYGKMDREFIEGKPVSFAGLAVRKAKGNFGKLVGNSSSN
jgi:hypothetical protein